MLFCLFIPRYGLRMCIIVENRRGGKVHPPDPNSSLNLPFSWINLLSPDKWMTHRLPLAFLFDCCATHMLIVIYCPWRGFVLTHLMCRSCVLPPHLPWCSRQLHPPIWNLKERAMGLGEYHWRDCRFWRQKHTYQWANRSIYRHHTHRWTLCICLLRQLVFPQVLTVGSGCGYRDMAAETSIGCSSWGASLVMIPPVC